MNDTNVTLEALLAAEDPGSLLKEIKFENGMKLLEELVRQVESGGLDLEHSMASYERGMIVLDHLRSVLERAEQKLQFVQAERSSVKTE